MITNIDTGLPTDKTSPLLTHRTEMTHHLKGCWVFNRRNIGWNKVLNLSCCLQPRIFFPEITEDKHTHTHYLPLDGMANIPV